MPGFRRLVEIVHQLEAAHPEEQSGEEPDAPTLPIVASGLSCVRPELANDLTEPEPGPKSDRKALRRVRKLPAETKPVVFRDPRLTRWFEGLRW